LQSSESKRLVLYTDGASRGNPGPAALAVKILDENGCVLQRFSKFLGKRTNNEAEYEALIAGLRLAGSFTGGQVQCFSDSELVVKQLNGEYEVRNARLEDLWLKVRDLQKRFREVRFHYVPREDKNVQGVDRQANRILDRTSSQTPKSL
jgi:ribonuclease HI